MRISASTFVRMGLLSLLVALGLGAERVAAQADASLPNPPGFPDENQPLVDQEILGKFLFWDEQLSFDNTMACGTCHMPEMGGSDLRAQMGTNPGPDGLYGFFLNGDDIAGSPGVVKADAAAGEFVHEDTYFPGPQVTNRKPPSIINAAHGTNLPMFWDGSALPDEVRDPVTDEIIIMFGGSLEQAISMEVVNEVHMGAAGWAWNDVINKLAVVEPMAIGTNLPLEMQDFLTSNPTYPDMFETVYGDSRVTGKNTIFAMANYIRTLISDGTPIDDFLNGDVAELSPELQAGWDLFHGDSNCAACHTMPFTANFNWHNIGVRPDNEDPGLMGVSLNPDDIARFKTPNIRNAKLRLPLFHSGTMETVTDLVEFYDKNINKFVGPHLDENIFNLYLSQQEKADLVFFVEDGLTDPRVEQGIFPFDRPTLRSELSPLNTLYGVASPSGTGEFMDLLVHVPATSGNVNWLFGVDDATPNMVTTFALAWSSDPAGTPFPDPRFPVPLNLCADDIFLVHITSTDAFGVATMKISIPADPAVSGLLLYGQVFVADPAAVTTGGIYGSEGVEFEIL